MKLHLFLFALIQAILCIGHKSTFDIIDFSVLKGWMQQVSSDYFIKENPAVFFAFNIYQAGQDGGPKAPLERLTAKLQTVKGKNTSSVYEIAGTKSTRRIYAVESLFNASPDQLSAKADPATVIQLYKLETSKNKRFFSLTPDIKVQSSMIAISFQSEDFGSTYKIIINGFLTPGEYAFIDKTSTTADGSVTVFAFGID